MSSTDINEKCTVYSKSDNSNVMTVNDADEFIQQLFDSHIHHLYQIGQKMRKKELEPIFTDKVGRQ